MKACIFIILFPNSSITVAGFRTPVDRTSQVGPFAITAPLMIHKDADESTRTPPSFQGVIFDIDGTLANSWKLGYDSTNQVLKNHGIPGISLEIYHQGTKYTTPERLARHTGLLPEDDSFHDVGQQLAREFDDLYIGLVTSETAGFYEGILPLLNGIPPWVRLGALTNAVTAYAHAVLKVNTAPELYRRFQSIQGADSVPKPKPHPHGLWKVCHELNIPPAQCIYVGDSPSDGVAALAAGLMFFGVTWGSHTTESILSHLETGADFPTRVRICHSVRDLQQTLQLFLRDDNDQN